MSKLERVEAIILPIRIREAINYGGKKYRTSTFTGEPVENFAAPVRFNLTENNFMFSFEFWEDVADFESDKKPIDILHRDFEGERINYPQFSEFFENIENATLNFLELESNKFKTSSINIDALNFQISASANHEDKKKYYVSNIVNGIEAIDELKTKYLDTIVLPFYKVAWDLAIQDRNLSKFK